MGEKVFIGDDNKRRLFLPSAKVIQLITGRDKKFCIVKLKTQALYDFT